MFLGIWQRISNNKTPEYKKNPEETSPEIQNRGTSGPKKDHVSAKNFKKKQIWQQFLSLWSFRSADDLLSGPGLLKDFPKILRVARDIMGSFRTQLETH